MVTPPASAPRAHDDLALARLLETATVPVVVEASFGGWEQPWRALADEDWGTIRRTLDGRARFASVDTAVARDFARREEAEILPEVFVYLRGNVVARLHGQVAAHEVLTAVAAAVAEGRGQERGLAELGKRAAPRSVPDSLATAG